MLVCENVKYLWKWENFYKLVNVVRLDVGVKWLS